MSDVVLRLEHVSKKFRKGEMFNSLRDLIPTFTKGVFRSNGHRSTDSREFWALNDVSLEVKQGEAFGIIGPNGAGKSTMLKLLSRVMRPTQGSIHVTGRISALIELGAGFHQDLTGRENIYLYGSILGMRRHEVDGKLDEIVEFSGLEEFLDTPLKRYSSGMCARLGFAVAAHVNPDVLLVDEVLSVGDFAFQQKCIQYMREQIRGGATVLFVSHNLKTIAEFCQRGLFLDRGRIAASGPIQPVISTYLNRFQNSDTQDTTQKDLNISKVVIRNQQGERSRFQSGESVWVDIETRAHKRCSRLSLSLYISDEHYESVFDTSSERLGHGTFTLEAGELYSCSIELQLNMAPGLFHLSALVYRYDTQTEYDRWSPATTIYVSCPEDVRGTVNCFPKVVRQEIRVVESDATSNSQLMSVAAAQIPPVPCRPRRVQ